MISNKKQLSIFTTSDFNKDLVAFELGHNQIRTILFTHTFESRFAHFYLLEVIEYKTITRQTFINNLNGSLILISCTIYDQMVLSLSIGCCFHVNIKCILNDSYCRFSLRNINTFMLFWVIS